MKKIIFAIIYIFLATVALAGPPAIPPSGSSISAYTDITGLWTGDGGLMNSDGSYKVIGTDMPGVYDTPTDGQLTKWKDDGGVWKLESAGAPVNMASTIETGLLYYNSVSGEVENAPTSLNLVTTGYVDAGVLVTKSTDATITVSGMSIFYVNADDDAIAFNLPAAATNKAYCFANALYARAITVNPDDADYIINGTTAGGAGKHIVSTGAKDEMICVVGIDASYWRVTTKVGTWALEE